MATENQKYANFGLRLLAYLIDVVVIMIASSVISMAFAAMKLQAFGTLVGVVVAWGYLIYFTGSTGQTLGKKALGLKVVKVGTNQNPDYVTAFLREIVGRFISSLVLLLGYLWIIWDDKRQGWHDKIAGTVVIKL